MASFLIKLIKCCFSDEGIAGSEPNTVSLRREIPILDVNDNAPEFHDRPYSFSVAETVSVGTTVFSNITVTDKDGGVNADIMLSCVADKDDEDVCSTFGVVADKVSAAYNLLDTVNPFRFSVELNWTALFAV
jgi:hypothetical protein